MELRIEERQPEANPDKPHKINTRTKKHSMRGSNSLSVLRCLDDPNPQENSRAEAPKKSARFINNSGAQMEKLRDLDRKNKHARMRM